MTSVASSHVEQRGLAYLWAKTDREHPDDADRYHALALHLVDVAAVTHELWRTSWSPYRRRRWSKALGVDEDLAGRWLAFVAGAHDLGKASLVFQGQLTEQLKRINRITGKAFTQRSYPSPLPHGLITAVMLPGILQHRFDISFSTATRLGLVAGAHHGRFANDGMVLAAWPGEGNDDQLGVGIWDTWRTELADYLARAVGLPGQLPEPLRMGHLAYADAEDLAGTISYADWIGSDVRFFPLSRTVPADPADAFADATAKARHALKELQFDTSPVPMPADSFSGMFTHIRVPNAGQDAAMRAMAGVNGPGIAVVEYPMGWGKTEIALWMAARWAQRDHIDGFYVAMPTRTTSDQLYERVHALLSDHGRQAKIEPQLIRVSGQTPMSVGSSGHDALHDLVGELDVEAGIAANADAAADPVPRTGGRSESDVGGGVASAREEALTRARWFGRRSRGLLARYGVGTVDQAMLGVLTTRHGFVRLAGLAGRTVIFDEVHSYDVYMSTIVDRLLAFLGALGSPVIILTATLPRHRTQQLVAAYAGGAGWPVPEGEIAAYPRLTVAARAVGQITRSVETPADDRPPLELERLSHDVADEPGMWREVADRLALALADDGTAAVICNTVAQAQDAFRALVAVFPEDELEVFHARFRQRERREIQERVLRDFGKQTPDQPPTRPRRRIVIATQVIEQSLDLDFDLMVSMFCPVDLLLQRSGRLQRHRKTDPLRPTGLRQPTLWLIGYDESCEGDVPRFARGSEAVYGRFPLLRSWWALRGREAVAIPADIEPLIEMAYAEDDAAPADAPWLELSWNEARDLFMEQRDNEGEAAGKQLILALDRDQPDVGKDALTAERSIGAPADELPPDKAAFAARTRLGPPSVTAVVLTQKEARDFSVAVSPAESKTIPTRVIAELLERSVTISTVGVTRELIATTPSKHWADVPALRFARLVLLDDDARCQIGERWSVRLDDRIGLLAERTDKVSRIPTEEEEE